MIPFIHQCGLMTVRVGLGLGAWVLVCARVWACISHMGCALRISFARCGSLGGKGIACLCICVRDAWLADHACPCVQGHHVHACGRTSTHTRMHMHTCTRMQMCTHKHAYTHTHTQIRARPTLPGSPCRWKAWNSAYMLNAKRA